MKNISIIGSGSWGVAIAIHLAKLGHNKKVCHGDGGTGESAGQNGGTVFAGCGEYCHHDGGAYSLSDEHRQGFLYSSVLGIHRIAPGISRDD